MGKTLHSVGSSGPYRLMAVRCPTSPRMFKTILESWCHINCSGGWKADIVIPAGIADAPEGMSLQFSHVDDLVLFMMSSEYGYMGSPEPS